MHQQHPEHTPSMTDASTPSSAPSSATPRRLVAALGGLVVAQRRNLEHAAYFASVRPSLSYHRALVRVNRDAAAELGARIAATRAALAALRPSTCGARCRDGHACRAPVVRGRRRCKLHGGLSTGPRTDEGRVAALAALARSVEARRALRAQSLAAPSVAA